MKKNEEKALFIQRLAAFIIDIFLISCVASLFSYPFLDNKSINSLTENATELIESYSKGDIDIDTYTSEVKGVTYELAKKQGVTSLITITLSVLYFVVYQYKKQGQTFGKKLLKIKVVSSEEELVEEMEKELTEEVPFGITEEEQLENQVTNEEGE